MTGAKHSIFLDAESNMILLALEDRYKSKSHALQSIIKEWAADRGITVKVTIEIEGLETTP